MDSLQAWAEAKGPKRLADLARLVIRHADVEFGRWAEPSRLRGDAPAQGFEGDAMAGHVQGAEGLVKGDGPSATLRGPTAHEDVLPVSGGAGIKDLLIGQVPGLPHPWNVLGEDSQESGHSGIARQAANLTNSLENGIGNYFIVHKENACIR